MIIYNTKETTIYIYISVENINIRNEMMINAAITTNIFRLDFILYILFAFYLLSLVF